MGAYLHEKKPLLRLKQLCVSSQLSTPFFSPLASNFPPSTPTSPPPKSIPPPSLFKIFISRTTIQFPFTRIFKILKLSISPRKIEHFFTRRSAGYFFARKSRMSFAHEMIQNVGRKFSFPVYPKGD